MLSSTFLWRPPQDYDVKPPNLTCYGGRGYIKSLGIQLQEKSPAFDILAGPNRPD